MQEVAAISVIPSIPEPGRRNVEAASALFSVALARFGVAHVLRPLWPRSRVGYWAEGLRISLVQLFPSS